MTEAAIITLIIVAGLATAFGLVVHYAFKAWQAERILQAEDFATIHINSSLDAEEVAAVARRARDNAAYLN